MGMYDIWLSQGSHDMKYTLCLVKQRLLDQCKQNLLSQIKSSSKCYVYKYLIDDVCLQFYLTKPISAPLKNLISKLRLSAHCLAIESGRYKKVEKQNRFCFICGDCVEDEYHFVVLCPLYVSLRQKYIKPYYWKKPSMYKFIQLLSSRNLKELCNLGRFLKCAFQLRVSVM